MEWTTLFSGNELEVYRSPASGGAALAVTFDYMGQTSRPPNVHAASFFRQNNFDQIHVASVRDRWYQTDELLTVFDIVAGIRRDYDRVVSYGNSMGAYGAMLISKAIDVDTVIAFAPQFTVDPSIMPEEKRWLPATAEIDFIFDVSRFLSCSAKIFIISDPFCAVDERHVSLFEAIRAVTKVRVPLAGHHPASLLKEVGVLDPFMNSMLQSQLPHSDLRRVLRSKRRQSPTYWMRLAQMLNDRHNLAGALRAATRAYSLDPNAAGPLETFFEILAFAPQYHAFADIAARLLEINFPNAAHFKTYRTATWARLETYRIVDN